MTLIDWTVAPRLERPETWTHQAACVETDPTLWFPDGWHEAPEAIAICQQCPVQQECLQDALRMDDNAFGIRGGLYPKERRKLLRRATAVTRNCTECNHALPIDSHHARIMHETCALEKDRRRSREARRRLARERKVSA